jgi:hypothetical protein
MPTRVHGRLGELGRLVGVQRPAPIHRRRVLWPELSDADTLTPRAVRQTRARPFSQPFVDLRGLVRG